MMVMMIVDECMKGVDNLLHSRCYITDPVEETNEGKRDERTTGGGGDDAEEAGRTKDEI